VHGSVRGIGSRRCRTGGFHLPRSGPRHARALLLSIAALVALAIVPAAAPAAPTTAHMKEVLPIQKGCEPKGLGGFALGAGGALPPGNHVYVVEALRGADVVSACPQVIVPVPPTAAPNTNAVLLQWRPATDATSYRVYRANGIGITPTQVGPDVPAAASCANPKRCIFLDGNPVANSGGDAPTPVGLDTRAGAHSDLQFRQTVDYGGADGNDDTPLSQFFLDPFSPDAAGGANEALRNDTFQFPAGLIANPRATETCDLTGEDSLLGDPELHGSSDPEEDQCSRASFLGTVQTVTRVPDAQANPANPFSPGRLSISFGDIYNAEAIGGEPGRLFAVIRPACSAGYPLPNLAPGSAQCNALLGGANREVEKEFLTSVANIVERPGAPGRYAIDSENFDIADGEDEDIKPYQSILLPGAGPGGTLGRNPAARIPRQLRELTQTLVGTATKDTVATNDDTPFVTLPTSCGDHAMRARKRTWDENVFRTSAADEGVFTTTSCATVPFNPALDAGPDIQRETPVGHHDTILSPADTLDGQHEAHQRDVTAQFPEGLNVSAAAGNVINAVGVEIGDVSGDSDELGSLNGGIRLTQVNPDGTFRIQAEVSQRNTPSGADSNVKLKLNALITPDPATGRLRADFDELPQVPFRRLQLEFFGGDTAALVAPPTCGTNIDHLEFLPWSTTGNAGQVSRDDGWDTVGCPAGEPPRAFSPTVTASLNTTQAAATSQLKVRIEKADRQQNLEGFDLELPSGLVTKLADFAMCPAANAQSGNCGADSQLGTVTIAAGNGGQPLSLPGKVFLSEPIAGTGDLASLVVVVPALVGPFDLGTVITRSRIKLDVPRIGVTTTTVDPLPTILKGVPVRVRSIELTLNNMRNPSSCDPDQFRATFRSQADPTTAATRAEGGRTANASTAFQATGCDLLPFSPKLGVSAFNKPGDHPSVHTLITQADGEANQSSAKVTLPAGLTPNPAVLQNLCAPEQLAGGGCPANSRVGTARANSPLLPLPLTGPVYVVSRPGEVLPKLVVQLRGILSLDLEGVVSLAPGGRLATTFTGLPNTPVTSFALDLIGGDADSGTPLFTSRADLCNGQQRADGEFTSYTGKSATDSALVTVHGACPPPVTQTAAQVSRNSGRATVSMKIKRVRKGRPVLEMRVARTRTSANLKRVTLRLPAGLRFRSKPTAAALAGLSVRTAGGRRVARRNIRIEKGRMVITHTAGTPVLKVALRRGIVTTGRTFRRLSHRRLTRRRLAFRVQVTDVQNERYTITKRIRPQS
jgi:hypothetical protein